MPLFDLARLLEEDKATEGLDLPYRFGKSFDVNLGLKDGKWQKTDSTMVWSLKIASDNAYSLNFIFSELFMPKGGKLYIYNEDGSVVYGPVTDSQNKHGTTFLTDIVRGEMVIIFISVPNEKQPFVKLTIQNVIHGYKNLFGFLSFEKSAQSCEKDVACYSSWNDESDGVVQILLANGDALCSGSLMNNTAQDFKPYILTAFHCIDIGDPDISNFDPFTDCNRDADEGDGELEQYEIDEAEQWLVRFRYKRTTCGGNIFATVRTFDDTFFRAGWYDSDFALVELQDDILRDEPSVGEKVWLGWDWSTTIPSSGVTIHHPAGDVMKWSEDDDNLTINSNQIVGICTTHPANNFWKVFWDIGLTEGGSSGAPLFNSAKRVVGQLWGGSSTCNNSGPDYFGRFSRSWTGGDSNTTRLNNWLNPTGSSATTLNSVRQPIPEYSQNINDLCSTTSLSITNLAPGYYLHHWNRSSNVSFSNGNTSNPVTIVPGTRGSGWIEAVYHTGWGTVTMERMEFWVGKPQVYTLGNNLVDINGMPKTDFCNAQANECEAVNIGGDAHITAWEWRVTGGTVYPYGAQYRYATIYPNSYSNFMVEIRAHNVCGWTDWARMWTEVEDCYGYYMTFSPNPTTSETTLTIKSENKEQPLDETAEWELEIYSPGQVLTQKTTKLHGSSTTIQTAGWKEGVYAVRVKLTTKERSDEILTGKLVVKK